MAPLLGVAAIDFPVIYRARFNNSRTWLSSSSPRSKLRRQLEGQGYRQWHAALVPERLAAPRKCNDTNPEAILRRPCLDVSGAMLGKCTSGLSWMCYSRDSKGRCSAIAAAFALRLLRVDIDVDCCT